MKRLKHQEISSEADRVDFYFDFKQQPSLKIESSDYIGNQILLKHLVSTLLRYKSGGVFQPYLAKSWSSSKDKKIWTFQLHLDFKTEDGVLITGKTFIKILAKNLKTLAFAGEVPIFQDLDGWAQFISGKSNELIGLQATDEEIKFVFKKAANEGFLEYLCMPYYGYVEYKSNGDLISSGPFAVASLNDNPIILTKKDNFPYQTNNIREVAIYRGEDKLKELLKTSNNLIVQSNTPLELDKNQFTIINGSPDILFSVVLDVGKSSIFKDIEFRAQFKRQFRERFDNIQLQSENSVVTQKLFLDFPSLPTVSLETESKKVLSSKVLNIFSIKTEDPDIKKMESVVTQTLDSMGFLYKIKRFGEDPEVTMRDKISREKFDLRIVSVYSGATFDVWVTDMMFCSNLGISFPDPSGQVCKLIKDEELVKDKKKIMESVALTIERDQSVIPVFYKTNIFYISKSLRPQNIEPDTVLIGFDEI